MKTVAFRTAPPFAHGRQATRSRPGTTLKHRPERSLAPLSAISNAALSGIVGESYHVSDEDIQKFKDDGFVHLRSVMTDEEMSEVIDPVYMKFMTREIEVMGNDLCDMSGAKDRTPDEYTVYNAMLPRRYYPAWQGNVFEQRCKAIADQLCGGEMAIDYDQILAKRPKSEDAVFAWHQDMAYWPPTEADTSTATCWLGVDESTVENGCMRFLPGSHLEPELREHAPVGSSREDSHALYTVVDGSKDRIVHMPIKRGDITVHNERVVHGSGPNLSSGWRRAYVLAFRKEACVLEERAMGFTHSHNDQNSWDVFHEHSNSAPGGT